MAALFILSFRHRDELTRLAESNGWEPISARRPDNSEARFIASGASVALVDARGARQEGEEAARNLGAAVEANAAAMLVLLSRGDAGSLETFYRLGATHFLVSPFTRLQLIEAVRFAQRHADRLGSHRPAAVPGSRGRSASWRWQPGSFRVEIGPAVARELGFAPSEGRSVSRGRLLGRLDRSERRAALAAITRVRAGEGPTAFAHPGFTSGGGRIAHHVRLDRGGTVVGRTEILPAGTTADESRDPLTGLCDLRSFRLRVGRELDRPGPVILVLLSASRYDAINSAFGRETGDVILQAIAGRITRRLADSGTAGHVARVAGAEFAVLLPSPATLEDGRHLAETLLETAGKPFRSGDHIVSLACRAGVAASDPTDDSGALLRRASLALARARIRDASPVKVVEGVGEAEERRDDQLEIDLRRALAKGEVEIRFQPQVAIATGRIVGAEALARWIHPEHGELGAATLFDVAERSDYLAQLSEHVQRKALVAAAAWPPSLGGLHLSVNITAADIVRPGFGAQFLEMVTACDFDPRRITIEVTEGSLIQDIAAAAALLAELRGGGSRVAIDDFGTGYSNLAYLRSLPLDCLKLDRRFCQDLVGSDRGRILLRSVIDMARSLGLDVVAEGVETEDQLAVLADEGCTLYQGFFCAPALDTKSLAELVNREASPAPC